MSRFYVAQLDLSAAGQQVVMDADQAHHARRVLRLGRDDAIELFDGRGMVAAGRIIGWRDDGQADVSIESVEQVQRQLPSVELAAAFPKGKRADEMVNQLCQLGVDRLTPLLTARASVKPRPGKIERLGKQVIEATKQCGRAYMMSINSPRLLKDVLTENDGLFLLADASDQTAAAVHPEKLRGVDRVTVLIGPEGGWTDQEQSAAREAGALCWSLGPHIMRIETAAVAAAAILGDLIHSR